MLLGIVRLNPATRQYSVESMATKDPQGKSMVVMGSANTAVEQMMDINRRLVTQIETLKLKVDVDARHYERTTSDLLKTTQSKMKTRELEVVHLKTTLKQKDKKLSDLMGENEEKSSKIQTLKEHIVELNEDLIDSKNYVDNIEEQLESLRNERDELKSGAAYKKKDQEIRMLQDEVDSLKTNLTTLKKQLRESKETIARQGGQLRLADMDRGNMKLKLKEELAKVTSTLRDEIGRIRDVMHEQWKEMKEFREHNDKMHSDLKEIKELLSEQLPVDPRGAGVYRPAHNPYDMQAMSPSLPSLKKDSRRKKR